MSPASLGTGLGRRQWVGDSGICPLLEELRVFTSDPDTIRVATESGFVAVSSGCRKLRYIFYFCCQTQMTNAAVATLVQNCPDIAHFCLSVMIPRQPDYLTNKPRDEGLGSVVKNCTKLQRLGVSGLFTDRTFEYIGRYAENLETLSTL